MSSKRLSLKQWIIYLVCLFVFQEVVFRIVFPIPDVSNFDRVKFMELGNHHAEEDYSRNKSWTWQSSLDTAHIFQHTMNLYGFRDKEWELQKPKGKKPVLFIGDSFVEGMMAQDNEQLTDFFKAKDSADFLDVLNAGIAGIGLDADLQLSADIIPLLKPDMTILCIYANDLGKKEPIVPSYFLEPEFYNKAIPRIIEVIKQLDYHGPLLPAWGGKERPYIMAVPDSTNPWTRHEKILSENISQKLAMEMKAGKVNPFLVNAFAKEEACLKKPPKLGETIPFFQFICKKNNTIPVIIYIPSRNQISQHYYPFEREMTFGFPAENFDLTTSEYNQHQIAIAQQCLRFKVPFLDLTQVVKKEEDKGNHLFWNYDEHMRPKGYKLIGERIYNDLTKTILKP